MTFKKFKYNADTGLYTVVISLIISSAFFWLTNPDHEITWIIIGIALFTFVLKEIIELIFFD